MTTLAAIALATLGTGWPGDLSSAAAGVPTCHDQPATIVGYNGQPLAGTPGPDVVVSNGATEIETSDGDDLVCVTGGSRKDDVDISAGDGDDVIDASTSTHGTRRVDLGDGNDEYVGADGPDFVFASEDVDAPSTVSAGADTIDTGAGDDTVATGGTPAEPDQDSIELGPGRDSAWLRGRVDPAYLIGGGAGRDELELDSLSVYGAMVIDNRSGRASDADTHADEISWSGMEDFRITPYPRPEAPSFIGGEVAEHVHTVVPLAEARMGRGDDKLDLDVWEGPLLADAVYKGGDGQDAFILMAGSGDQAKRVTYDRRNGAMFFERDSRHGSDLQVDGFDRFRWSTVTLEVRGTAGPDHFEWLGCHGFVAGRGGDDVLKLTSDEDAGCGYLGENADLVTRGGRGDDRLLGNYMPDILLGGPGTDVARGDRGDDRCVAETEVGCER